jgi:hypothetical protein
MGLSMLAYSKHRGVSYLSVRRAIAAGRISVLPDGSIDPVQADAEWERNTPDTRMRSNKVDSKLHGPSVEDAAATPPLSGQGPTLLQARTLNEVLKAKIRQVQLAEKKEELVNRAKAVAHVFKLARAERDAWLNWPNRVAPQLAAKLSVDEHTLHLALDEAVRGHLEELGEFAPSVD